ncbi:MAG: hypothetical protein ACXWEY_06035 [Bacteroidia bacterium]
MKFVFLFVFINSTFFLFSCGKVADDAYDYYQVPNPLYFVVLDSAKNNLINNYNRDSIKLFYFQNNKKEYIEDFAAFDSFPDYRFVCSTRDAALKSVEGIKKFYFEMPNSKIDTLFIDVVEEKNKDCVCMFPYKLVKFNKSIPETDSKNSFKPYLFVK